MNFIAKQVIKNKTGGITDKFDEFSKKCKDLVISDEQSTSDPVVQQTDEEKTAKIVSLFESIYYIASNNLFIL